MVEVEICSDAVGGWTTNVLDPFTGIAMQTLYIVGSRGQLIAVVRSSVPLTHLIFVDRMKPTEPPINDYFDE